MKEQEKENMENMVNLKISSLSDQKLIVCTKEVAKEEKQKTQELILYLLELDKRGLWGKLGHSNVFHYLVKELHYSEGEASCRVRALRLVKASPLAAEKMQNGELGLTQAAKLHSFFNYNEKGQNSTVEEKNHLIEEVSGKSTRKVDEILEEKGGKAPKVEKIAITPTLAEKWKKVKGMYSQEMEDLSLKNETLLEVLLDEKIRNVEFSKPIRQNNGVKEKTAEQSTSRYIPRAIKIEIFNRSGGWCEYTSKLTQQRCGERIHLQYDHVLPLALGGKTEKENLRILCAGHNSCESKIMMGGEFIAKMKDKKVRLD